MKRLYIGIDPGLHGAASVIDSAGEVISVQDTPTLLVRRGKKNKNTYILTGMITILESFRQAGSVRIAGLENQHSRPGQGAPATFSSGYGFGLWEMALTALRIPYSLVEPQTWKKKLSIPPKSEKNASIIRAHQLFPKASLNRVKDDGRAESLLIAEYVRRAERGK